MLDDIDLSARDLEDCFAEFSNDSATVALIIRALEVDAFPSVISERWQAAREAYARDIELRQREEAAQI